MTLKVIHWLQAFSSAIRRTFVQHFTTVQLSACSRGPSATAGLFVRFTMYIMGSKPAARLSTPLTFPPAKKSLDCRINHISLISSPTDGTRSAAIEVVYNLTQRRNAVGLIY